MPRPRKFNCFLMGSQSWLIQCFAELIDELAVDQVKLIQQNLDLRTYFPRWKRPPAACTINWSCSAEEIDALFRGLDYGHYPNTIGLPKLFLGDQVIVVKQINILQSVADMAHGTLTCIHEAGGNVLIYRDLALQLSPDQPFYGLQAKGLDGEQPFHTRI